MSNFAIISILALASYFFLFLALMASQKDKLIKSFITILIAMILWSGGSFSMRMQYGPSIKFWYDISMAGLILLPFVFYQFTIDFIGKAHTMYRHILFASSLLLILLNTLTGCFLQAPHALQTADGSMMFVYDFTWRTYLFSLFFVAVALQIVSIAYKSIRENSVIRHQFTPILAGMGILLLGHASIMLDFFQGIPLDILSGVINAFLMFYVLYRRRLFKLTLLVSRGNCYLISALITIVVFANMILPLESLLCSTFHIPVRYATLAVSLLITGVTALVYILLKKFIDEVFIKEEKKQADQVKNFSHIISRTLQIEEIAEQITEIIAETIDVRRIYICLESPEEHGYRIRYGNAPLEHYSYMIDRQNPLIKELEQNGDYLIYRDFKRSVNYRSMWEKEKELFESLQIECIIPLQEQKLVGMILLGGKHHKSIYTYDELNFLASIASISAIALKNSQLYEIAYKEARTDELTGLLNRKYFYETFQDAFDHMHSSLTLILVSLDDVRLYNQLYGTSQGDRVIQMSADIMRRMVGDNGTVARLGGKEFAILLPEYGLQEAKKQAENIRQAIMKMNKSKEDYALKVFTGSFGISSIPLNASNPKQLEEYANQALFQAKQKGKNCVVIYNEETQNQDPHTYGKLKNKESIYSEYAATIYALTAAIDTKDHYTFTHSKNVAYYATELAYALGMNEELVEIIREAALLHDIGKIGIKEEILNKKGKLSEEEYEIMKTHVENSIGIIRHLPSLDYVIPAVISHHERYDGHGYPRKIKGTDIPLAGRILCIADSFDAMTSRRSYKDSYDLAYAISELKAQAGHQFDPELAELFISLLESEKVVISTEQPEV